MKWANPLGDGGMVAGRDGAWLGALDGRLYRRPPFPWRDRGDGDAIERENHRQDFPCSTAQRQFWSVQCDEQYWRDAGAFGDSFCGGRIWLAGGF
ncbi:MAG: hypothetical protein ABT10_11980 [Novosphingobium sp. SCN 63-17]|nr:MAG: hypothetical protein ABT10_11980 [Novosphingobium sp. SCN 63-17]OJX96742.1 MAG: hypothetical protein BGP00_19785 [Novosphingobium sp. 63-713]